MTANDFYSNLISQGYIGNPTGVPGVYAFQSPINYERHMIVTLTEDYDFLGVQMDMEVIYRDISYRFSTNKILFVLFTNSSINARTVLNSGLMCWIYNTVEDKLEIYAGQPYEFFNVKSIIGQGVSVKKKKEPVKIKHKIVNFTNLFILINVLIHIILDVIGDTSDGQFMLDNGAINVECILRGEVYRLFTAMFLHFDYSHLLGNMFVLFLAGRNLENMIGRWKFAVIYMVAGLGSSVVATLYYLLTRQEVVCAGASGAIYGIVGAMIWALIIHAGKRRKFILWQVIVGGALSLGQGFMPQEGVSGSAHIGGFVVGFLIALIMCRKRGIKDED